MNASWLKIVTVVAVVLVGIILVKKFSASNSEPKPEPKTFYDVVAEDDKRLRADVEAPKPQEAEPAIEAKQPLEAEPPPKEEMNIEDQVQAERLFEMAITERKMARLPHMSYKRMVDYCREIIEKYPSSPQAPKARRMLGEVPKQYWPRYGITEREVNPAK